MPRNPKSGLTRLLGGRHWATYDGTDAGAETYETRVIRQGLCHFDLNLVFQGFKTTKGYWVAQDRNRHLIYIPNASGKYTRQEIYGPNFRSMRASRQTEKSLIEQGGDILYVTNEGIFRASEVGDKIDPRVYSPEELEAIQRRLEDRRKRDEGATK
jgi:hypothetical protein